MPGPTGLPLELKDGMKLIAARIVDRQSITAGADDEADLEVIIRSLSRPATRPTQQSGMETRSALSKTS